MTLPASGAISFNNINVELGVAGTTQASLGQSSYRSLAGVPSGQISMNNFYGKANQFAFTISSPQTNADLRTLALNAGWPGSSLVIATISPGVVISSNSTGTSALTISGAFPGGVQLTNSGTIVGRGGNGGAGGPASPQVPGSPGGGGGPALAVSVAVTLNNTGTIAGGGGGGGGGANFRAKESAYGGGGGGGGRSSLTNSSGGAAGPGPTGPGNAGNAGTFSAAGSGGNAQYGASGGSGGGWGSGGSSGVSPGGSGGAAGSAISGNPNITYISTGTRLGPIS